MATTLDEAHEIVAAARRITVLTGAGISTDSGIPDFRGPNGVWTKNPEAERLATLDNYLRDPELRRRGWRARLGNPIFEAEPNAGHRALVELERQGRLVAIATQNVDGLHQKAGSSPDLVHELHGSVRGWVCWGCRRTGPIAEVLDRVRAGDDDPACLDCGGIIKTTTVSFGQNLEPEVLDAAADAASRCDLMLAVGSSLGVHPAAGIVPLAVRHGAALVIVNAQETPYDPLADAVVRDPISDALPRLVERERVTR